MGSFTDQLKAFKDKTMFNFNAVTVDVIQACTISLVDKSVVGHPELWASKPPKSYQPGRFKANWQGGFNYINDLTTDDVDETGEISITSVFSQIPDNLEDGSFYITNSLPYGPGLEDGTGTRQPSGFVALTVLDFQKNVVTSIQKIRSI